MPITKWDIAYRRLYIYINEYNDRVTRDNVTKIADILAKDKGLNEKETQDLRESAVYLYLHFFDENGHYNGGK